MPPHGNARSVSGAASPTRGLVPAGVACCLLLLMAHLPAAVPDIEGLWSYQTIGRAGGPPARLSGLFVFKGGRFVQQSLNDGEPYDRQLGQAHAGTYSVEGDTVKLVAEVGMVVDPTKTPALDSRRNSVHELRIERKADRLTLTFGTGTVQTFTRLGPGSGEITALDRGALALVDGHFLLVAESGPMAIAGSGTFERTGATLRLQGARWLDVDAGTVRYDRNRSREATLDAAGLHVDGHTFARARR